MDSLKDYLCGISKDVVMKYYKELLNDAMNDSGLRKISAIESNALKKCLLDIYIEVERLCNLHGLTIMLAGGSCLGAIRHKGFIPWDDDMDFLMPRPDYEKLILLLESGAMGDAYEFVYPNKKKDTICLWLQIFNKETRLITMDGERKSFPNGCYIDIFPIDGVPSNVYRRKIKGWISNTIRLIANMVLDAKTPMNPILRSLCHADKGLKRMIYLRRFMGRLFSIVSHKRWAWWFDCYSRDFNMNGFVGVPAGRNLYFKESHQASVFFPPRKGFFEGRLVWLPNDYDKYLHALLGDYMKIPPEEKRESHFVKEISIPKKYYSC